MSNKELEKRASPGMPAHCRKVTRWLRNPYKSTPTNHSNFIAGFPPRISETDHLFLNAQVKYDVKRFWEDSILPQITRSKMARASAGIRPLDTDRFLIELDYTHVPLRVAVTRSEEVEESSRMKEFLQPVQERVRSPGTVVYAMLPNGSEVLEWAHKLTDIMMM